MRASCLSLFRPEWLPAGTTIYTSGATVPHDAAAAKLTLLVQGTVLCGMPAVAGGRADAGRAGGELVVTSVVRSRQAGMALMLGLEALCEARYHCTHVCKCASAPVRSRLIGLAWFERVCKSLCTPCHVQHEALTHVRSSACHIVPSVQPVCPRKLPGKACSHTCMSRHAAVTSFAGRRAPAIPSRSRTFTSCQTAWCARRWRTQRHWRVLARRGGAQATPAGRSKGGTWHASCFLHARSCICTRDRA